ncbi:adenosine deaminase [Coprinopsis cinerea AmutBmut pab1-1]|nr:adenosine deaminase [Coprinopsis cinerea AmutBmut pab1-1]
MELKLESYRAAREALINADRALRRDRLPLTTTINSLGPGDLETKADAILRRIRQEEADTIWTEVHPSIPHPFPGMEFLTGTDVSLHQGEPVAHAGKGKSIIEKTKIFKILSKMPKGGLLHAHLDATVNAQVLMKLVEQYPAYHVSVDQVLTEENLYAVLPQFEVFTAAGHAATSITSDSYSLGSWVPYQDARKNFAFGGADGFDRWVNAALTINPKEAYETYNTSTKIWEKFSSVFICARPLVLYEPVFEQYVREFFLSSIADGISYVEPRFNFYYKTMVGADGSPLEHRQWLLIFDRVLKQVKEELESQGRGDEFHGARVIYTSLRFLSPEEVEWYLEDCLALKKEFPHLIAGFDLVGEENAGRPLIDFLEVFMKFEARQKEEGVSIPFIFHAGETLGDGTHADCNLYDAILLGTKRIGHAFSLAKHPEILKICREKGIAIEVCPIS